MTQKPCPRCGRPMERKGLGEYWHCFACALAGASPAADRQEEGQ